MKTFPMFVRVAGRKVVVVGGGEQAAQKTRLLLKTDAHIHLLAEELEPELADLVREGRVTHRAGPISPIDFGDTALVFVATGCKGADSAFHMLAKSGGAVVNVVDRPDLCDVITPSIVDRDPVVVAIGTEGTAPVLARQIKSRVEELLEPRLGDLAAFAGNLRADVAQRVRPDQKRAFWSWVFGGPPRLAHAQGREREVAVMMKTAIAEGGPPDRIAGLISIVAAGPGDKDLMTLRGVQRLQEADVIYYDDRDLIDILDLARRDAERVFVGETPGAARWPEGRMVELMTAAARTGARVVALSKGGSTAFSALATLADTGGTAPLAAGSDMPNEAHVAVEIVPGVDNSGPDATLDQVKETPLAL